jgi:tetratricopeptide (TPR) repeat protein
MTGPASNPPRDAAFESAETEIDGLLEPALAETQLDSPPAREPAETVAPPGVPSGEPDTRAGKLVHLGGFEIERELARGGMGVVYVARSPSLGRRVALKVLLAGELATDEAVERFQREAQAAARLKHPAVVGVHEVGEDGGRHYIVMDLIEGESLKARLTRSGPLPTGEAARLTLTLARGLAHAHQEGILHRDMKPANVLLDRQDQPLITDFGLAKVVQADGEGPTRTGQLMGTPAYMPPEQADGGAAHVDARADVYSLGATLYHMLCGRPPFRAPTTLQLIHQVMSLDPVAPGRLQPGIDRDLETICLQCLEKDPSQRYASADDLADDLARYLAHQPILARRANPLEWVQKWVRRNQTVAWVGASALAVISLLSLGGAVWIADARATARAEQSARERRAEENLARQRDEVEGWLERAHRGELSHAEARRAAVLGILRHPGPMTRDLLTVRLNEVATDLVEITERALLAAEQPTADEARAGAKPLVGLPDALRVRRATASGERLPEQAEAVLHEASERLMHREHRVLSNAARAGRTLPSARQILARAQAAGFSLGEADEVRLICDALGQLEATRATQEALANFISVTEDEQLAVSAGVALCRLGTPRAVELAVQSCHRFGYAGVYASGVRSALQETEVSLPAGDEGTPRALHLRAELSLELGDLSAALADISRALAIEPDNVNALLLRAACREVAGEVDEARRDLDRVLELDPGYSGAWYNRGRLRRAEGDLVGALADYDQAVSLLPQEPRYLTNRGGVKLSLGDLVGAAADLEQALEKDATVAPAWQIRGSLRMEQGDVAAAIADYEHALELDPTLELVWIRLTDAYEQEDRLVEAQRAVERALELDPDQPDALAQLASVKSERGDPAAALAHLDRAIELGGDQARYLQDRGMVRGLLGDPEGALEDLDRAVALEPENGELLSSRAVARKTVGRLEEARTDCDKALELNPADADTWSQRGLIRQALGELDGALADHLEAVRLAPASPSVWSNLGTGYSSQGRRGEAVEAYTRAIELDPQLAMAWSNRGSAREALGDLERARADYDRALELDPTFAGTWFNRGNVRKQAGDVEGALADYGRALEVDPNHLDAWINRGNTRLAKRDLPGALSDYARAVELAPKDPMVRRNRAHIFRVAGKVPEAVRELELATQFAPSHLGGWLALGNARGAVGDMAGARRAFDRVLELEPAHVEAHLARGLAWKLEGDQEAALADYTRALEHDPRSGKAWYYRATGRADAGDLRGALDDFAALLELDPEFVDGWRLRGELAAKAGDVVVAKADLARFLRLAPDSPEAPRIRALLEALDEGAGRGRQAPE